MARTSKDIIEYRIYELELDKPFLCLYGEEWKISNILSNRLHFHNCLEIGYCLSDSGFLGFENGVTLPFKAGDIFLIPRFVPHTTCSAAGCRSQWSYLFIDPDIISRIFSKRFFSKYQSMPVNYLQLTADSHPRLYFICQCLLEEAKERANSDSSLFTLYALTLNAELRCLLSKNNMKNENRSREFILKPALEYINAHYADPCSIEKLSALCHLSQTHFRRLFLSVMGTQPLQYVIQIRIRQACILLNSTSDPITAIAQAVGFNSISSFNRNFLHIMGVSPQKYRVSAKPIEQKKTSILPLLGWMEPEEDPLA